MKLVRFNVDTLYGNTQIYLEISNIIHILDLDFRSNNSILNIIFLNV